MASREFHVSIENKTTSTFKRAHAALSHGAWTVDALPPETITANGVDWFRGESDGFMTGVEGRVHYAISNPHLQNETVYIHFNNPYWGSNDFSAVSSHHPDSKYRFHWQFTHGGDFAVVTLEVRMTATAAVSHCSLDQLFTPMSTPPVPVDETIRQRAFTQLRSFRDEDFQRYPGLDYWWWALEDALPDIIDAVNEDVEVRDAIASILEQAPNYLEDRSRAVRREDCERIRFILGKLMERRDDIPTRFGDRTLEILSAIEGLPWEEAVAIASSVKPQKDS